MDLINNDRLSSEAKEGRSDFIEPNGLYPYMIRRNIEKLLVALIFLCQILKEECRLSSPPASHNAQEASVPIDRTLYEAAA
ncbi:MAG: hypothetical protein U9N82_09595 [Thermodesulfobacteriota bacterium]|nr:hypothetical protein [Thermodesulfobacteriota bacterium]